jgi:DNA invertase Pin-like site-specific DNA recombinase
LPDQRCAPKTDDSGAQRQATLFHGIGCTKIPHQNSGMKLVGYARVSTRDQTVALQHEALRNAGCEVIYDDVVSGRTQNRTGLDQALAALSPGDVLIVWKLDRLGRSMQHVVNTVLDLDRKGIGFRSLTEAIDLSGSTGKLLLSIFGWLAEVERDLTTERTKAGLAAAKRRGVKLGRKRKLSAKDVDHARRAIESGEETVAGMARILKVGRNTLGRAIRGILPSS